MIRENPHYRREAFVNGLQAAGYKLRSGEPAQDVACDDILVTWNRYGHFEVAANDFERRGGRVVVAENGYLGANGSTPKFDVAAGDVRPGHYYALALNGHNGSGAWPSDDGSRWRALGIELKLWRAEKPGDREIGKSGDRKSDFSISRPPALTDFVALPPSRPPALTEDVPDHRHILVCPQRGIGPNRQAQHPAWPQDVTARLKALTQRPVRVRPHPGLGPGTVPIAQDLEGCWAVVTWASGAGIHALVAGVPVFFEAKHWILADAAERDIKTIESPALPERLPAFERLACAQWTVAEIASGEAFRRLLT